MTTKNKLVRDNIPDIIESEGYEVHYHILDKDEYTIGLKNKLREEVEELNVDENLEELADVYEVLMAMANNLGYSKEKVEEAAKEKRDRKGSFKNRVYLEWYDKIKK
jgi:predicted house-cleaning noncanonical NTP pyrophosphatase (MazG superfamily)